MPGYEVDVVDDAGRRVPDGEVGNIAVRAVPGPLGLFAGYYKDPKATAERMVRARLVFHR